ncbi:hypothetical protein PV379_46555, partial [Streptomyces caniscabiei]|nr:hypothetical protein [Streptomyces caniscabiei]
MQQSAVPELAHTHTRPIHWLATATALAGVVALSSALQPDAARAVAVASQWMGRVCVLAPMRNSEP